MSAMPLVSILIPTYNSSFFEQALVSALNQTYANIEIIVADDSDDGLAEIIAQKYANAKLRYVKNQHRRGFHGNFAYCFDEAQGEYIKFLNHDDVLKPQCVETMVKAFDVAGSPVTLVTTRRQIINAQGQLQPDRETTAPFSLKDVAMSGLYLGDYVLTHGVNIIGEPTTAMFRKADINVHAESLFCIKERQYLCLADMCLWLRLLAKGKAVYLANTQSYFRIHDAQLQATASSATLCLVERIYLPIDARALGFLADPSAFLATINAGVALIKQYQNMPGMNEQDRAEMTTALSTAAKFSPHE